MDDKTKDAQIVDMLRTAKALIADPRCWTQRAWARDKHGHSVSSRAPSAVRWCAAGAVQHDPRTGLIYDAIEELSDATMRLYGIGQVTAINDRDSLSRKEAHQAVLRVFDEAIKKLGTA